jgi:hypothetical protein
MKVCVLSPYPSGPWGAIEDAGDSVDLNGNPAESDFVVLYGHRDIIKGDLLKTHYGRIVNLHTSWLPYNKGADPNFWSWYDDTPKGVTIHYVDAGVDTGPVIDQRILKFRGDETLASSYWELRRKIERLFADAWWWVRKQPSGIWEPGRGTVHKKADREKIWHLFPKGWDTPCFEVRK